MFFLNQHINIEDYLQGYQGQGVKTILPSEVKMAWGRLVPGLEPQDVLIRFDNNWFKNGCLGRAYLYFGRNELPQRIWKRLFLVLLSWQEIYSEGSDAYRFCRDWTYNVLLFAVLKTPMMAFGPEAMLTVGTMVRDRKCSLQPITTPQNY